MNDTELQRKIRDRELENGARKFDGVTTTEGDHFVTGGLNVSGEINSDETTIGDVTGPSSAVDGNFASFDGTGGKTLKDSGSKAADFATAAHTHAGWTFLTAPLTSTSWEGNAHSTTAKTAIDLSSVFNVPAGVKAILANVEVRDSGSSNGNSYMILSPNDTDGNGLMFLPSAINNFWTSSTAVIPCNANGDVYYQIAASGTNTFQVSILIWGYCQ